MTLTSDIKEIREDVGGLKIDIAKINVNLENHLKHHMSQRRWVEWIPTFMAASLALIILIKGFGG